MEEKNKKLGEKVFKAVIAEIKAARKYNKEHPNNVWNRKSQQADIAIWDNSEWVNDRRVVKDFVIRVENKEVCKVPTCYDLREIFYALTDLLNRQKRVKGWGGLNWDNERVNLVPTAWSGYEVTMIPKVCFADAPCKEYKALQNYINKHGKQTYWGSTYGAVQLDNYQLFSAAMGGKRGSLWDEYGERVFLDNKPKKCARILEELRKHKGSKDVMICEGGEENYIDPEEQRHSAYYEVECEGEKRRYIKITIKTPSGKVKYCEKIY